MTQSNTEELEKLRIVVIEPFIRDIWRELVESLGLDDQDYAETLVAETGQYVKKLISQQLSEQLGRLENECKRYKYVL